MNAISRPLRLPRRAARGVSLLFILLMMVVLGFIGLAGMSTGIVQEKMAGNARDQAVAMQAAEAALRDAEADIEANLTPTSGFTDTCAGGLCVPPSMTASAPDSTPQWRHIDWTNQARAYGSATGAPNLLGPANQPLAAQPRYFIELLPSLPPAAGNSACIGCSSMPSERARAYRIAVRASGVRATTVVMLQSVYIKQ